MGKVIPLKGLITCLELKPDEILNTAKGQLEGVVIIGYDKQGEEYFASSYGDGGMVLWLLERMKRALLSITEDDI